jgi:hypothetical protein
MQNPLGLIEPKEVLIDGKAFILSKFPAVEGREILTGSLEKISYKNGEYPKSEELMYKSLSYVAVPGSPGLAPTLLTNKTLINIHMSTSCPAWTLVQVEKAMEKHNFGFLLEGLASTSSDVITQNHPA